ncbi:MAG: M20/M25/M40 family metallo-hydrolase, partial [Myxococcota bacterium]
MTRSSTIDLTSADYAVTLLADFIGCKTDNPDGDELALAGRGAPERQPRGADPGAGVVGPPNKKRPGGYVFATFGEPRLLINVHLDTVPANTGWSRDPFTAEITEDRVYGLGSADTKGAMAALLVALSRVRTRNLAVLFSGDEEAGSEVIRAFAGSGRLGAIERAIVCEPTRRRGGVRHRGINAYRAHVHGLGGHSSGADHMPKPVVTMARLAVAIDEIGQRHRTAGPDDMRGLCMNVAALDGGVAFNVVPDSAALRWSLRPPPEFDMAALRREFDQAVRAVDPAIEFDQVIEHKPFACRDPGFYRELLGGFVSDFVPLDFWTEAAVL